MYDIELLLVRFGKKLKIVFSHFKWYHLVQNDRFTHEHYLQNEDIRKFRLCYGALKFKKIKFRLANFKNLFSPLYL